MNGCINADLIHLALLHQEQILVEIEIAQIFKGMLTGGGAEGGQEDTGYGHGYLQIGGSSLDNMIH
jgi:hypothetical protein